VHLGLDCCGHLCAATGRPAEAVTAWAAMSALAGAWPPPPGGLDPARRDTLRHQARDLLGHAAARAAEGRGAAMTLAMATEYALLLSAGSRPPAGDGAAAAAIGATADQLAGLGRLSPRERELVTLVARGRTDAQIAAELFITVRTVGSHLDRIRDKTGCRRRADLTRLALSAGLV
jgi:DNA-binding CsgD family transcriptional regulator